MENPESLQKCIEEGILTITFNTPSQLNALTSKTIQQFQGAIQEAYDNNDIKGVMFTGAGEEAFATGTPTEELLKLNELNARKFAENGQEIFALIENCSKPTLAAINGYALGGGFELALACHFRLASENAILGFPEIAFGMTPGFGGTQRLTNLVGRTKALELLMTGKCVTAEEGEAIGLVSDVVSYKEEMIKKGRSWIKQIIVHEPLAIGMLVNCINGAQNPEEDGYQTEANCFANCFKAPSFKENLKKLRNGTPGNFQEREGQ